MSANKEPAATAQPAPGFLERFRGELARDNLRMWSASFSDPAQEAAYQRHLITVELPKIRMIGLVGVIVWYLFGILDVLTISENLGKILVVRGLISGPVGIICAVMLWTDRFKQSYGVVIAAAILVFSFAILAMIALMPTVGAPPYIIGILVVFAYSSCFNRISFSLGAAIYTTTSLAYTCLLAFGGKFTQVDVIAGIFFMSNIASIAVITHYAQEIRSRQIWRRNRQRALDAAYIEELLIEATAADQSKINFISILSHELRTPLHQIIGFSEVVQQSLSREGADELGGFVTDIRGSAHELLARIGKMLRYADATAGKIKYEVEDIPASDLVETVLVQAREKADKRSISFDTSALAEALLLVDHHHTSYALGHIVENAVTASKNDATIFIKGRPSGDGAYILEIEDAGIGMTPEQITAAFEPFAQVEQLRTRSRNGLGLGLTLARKIFQDQNAELSIASVKDAGTTVTMRLPLAPTRRRAARAEAA